MKFKCAHCGKTADRPTGHVNRQRALGLNLYCGRRCSGLGRRKPRKTKAQRVEDKRLYDIEYRRKHRAMLKAKKAERHRRTYDPAKARIERKKNMARHVEYCRRPEYRSWKREYDRQLRAAEYGPFAEAYTLLLNVNREIKQRMNDYEIRKANDTLNKRQARARADRQEGTRDGHRAA